MIRPGRPDDLDVLVEGNAAMAFETEGIHLDRATLRRGVAALLAGEVPGAYRVVEENGRVVGQLLLTYEWSDWRAAPVWWIQSVYVWPERRRMGLYRQMYAAVRAEARAAGAAGLRLYVARDNVRAQQTYASLGMDGGRYAVFEEMFGPH